jgi:hypothetical protein
LINGMRVVIVDTYYPKFLASHYARNPALRHASYPVQRDSLLQATFGTSDFYSRHLNDLGWEAHDLISNCVPLQSRWASDRGVHFSKLALRMSHRFYRLPVIGPWLAALPGFLHIVMEQVRAQQPDVLYCQDVSLFPPDALRTLSHHVPLIVGQIASPLPPQPFLEGYNLILTSFPHFVPRLRATGVASQYLRIGFEARVLGRLGPVEKDIDASFVGGLSRHHGKAIPTFEYLARRTPIQFFGYGVRTLGFRSPIRPRHHGEVWGMDMYRALARSRVTLNRHIDVAENFANNMRLYEATGVGTLLITDQKDNLDELFKVGKEVVAYTSPEEAADLIRYYLSHPDEAEAIAKAGQERTLRDHTYRRRMEELVAILKSYL